MPSDSGITDRDVAVTAVWGDVGISDGFLVLLRSWQVNAPRFENAAVLMILYDGPLCPLVREMEDAGLTRVVESPGIGENRFVHRHRAYLERLSADRATGRVLTLDARDTVVQSDPFALCPADRVLVSPECVLVGDCPWNAVDQYRHSQSLPPGERDSPDVFGSWPVVNGAVTLGPAGPMKALLADRVRLDARLSEATDQASLTRLVAFSPGRFAEDSTLCFHGYAMRGDPSGFPLFHQWDRTPHRDSVLRRWGDPVR